MSQSSPTGQPRSIGFALMLLLAATGCGVGGPSIEELEAERTVYVQQCAACHEVPGAIGPPLYARVLVSYGTARRLFDYLRLAMPYQEPRSLTDEEYWMSVAHLLRSRGFIDSATTVNAQTAPGIELDSTVISNGR